MISYAAEMENEVELANLRFKELSQLVGNTSLLGIGLTLRGKPRVIYAKVEQLDRMGSIKHGIAHFEWYLQGPSDRWNS